MLKEKFKKIYNFLKEDTWQSWLVSLILIILLLKLIIFPGLSLILNTPLPLVVVESCSMYHSSGFENWWNANGAKYEARGINKEQFQEFSLKNGLNKGDIIIVKGKENYEAGDIVIFIANTQYPIIHRLIRDNPYQTLGDNNPTQLAFEQYINDEQVIGQAWGRIPLLGWVKLIFFEPFKSQDLRGFCN